MQLLILFNYCNEVDHPQTKQPTHNSYVGRSSHRSPQKYSSIHKAIADKYKSSQIPDDMYELRILIEEIQMRMEQLDNFYKDNFMDPNISIFHMLKIRLKKAVFEYKKLIDNKVLSLSVL